MKETGTGFQSRGDGAYILDNPAPSCSESRRIGVTACTLQLHHPQNPGRWRLQPGHPSFIILILPGKVVFPGSVTITFTLHLQSSSSPAEGGKGAGIYHRVLQQWGAQDGSRNRKDLAGGSFPVGLASTHEHRLCTHPSASWLKINHELLLPNETKQLAQPGTILLCTLQFQKTGVICLTQTLFPYLHVLTW